MIRQSISVSRRHRSCARGPLLLRARASGRQWRLIHTGLTFVPAHSMCRSCRRDTGQVSILISGIASSTGLDGMLSAVLARSRRVLRPGFF